ncbi:transporter substrate-binding domain-containing protein [Alkalimarinus coralli]|uniref:transporter substrate-binding domain-containing protein n=1 Tax=Alkalimarinus coralli TaxID=2935863 RepID=UPI00202B7970|nr:transporter substrate-binding domain-containing protein [Alkalimarinus coralli]
MSVKIAGYDYPPLYYLNESEQVEGDFFDVLNEMCRRQRFKCTFVADSAARSYKQLEDGAIDLLLTGKIPRFEACCDVIDWSYLWTGGIYSREQLTQNVDTSLLIGRSLVVPLGLELPYIVFKDLRTLESQSKAIVIEARTAKLTLKMFGKGRGDFVWSSKETEPLLKSYSASQDARYYFYPLKTIPVVVWIKRSNPHYQRILEGFNQAYAELMSLKRLGTNGLLLK